MWGHNAIFRFTELAKGALHSTSLIGISGKAKAKQNYLICNILSYPYGKYTEERQHQVSILYSIIES